MALIHTLISNGVRSQIDEPIGYDDFKVTFSRGEYHGIGVESSVGTLEFAGAAGHILKDAYDRDIDTEVKYEVKDGSVVIYEGVCDLSTIQEQTSEYYSVACKVAEIGIKTTFNNRVNTEVDLNTMDTIGGEQIERLTPWKKIAIPEKHFIYTNNLRERKRDLVSIAMPASFESRGTVSTGGWWLNFGVDNIIANEFGDLTGKDFVKDSSSAYGGVSLPIYLVDTDAIYQVGSVTDFREKYGNDTEKEVEVDFRVRVKFDRPLHPSGYTDQTFTMEMLMVEGDLSAAGGYELADELSETNVLLHGTRIEVTNNDYMAYKDFIVHGNVVTSGEKPLLVGIWIRNNNTKDGSGSGRSFNKGLQVQFEVLPDSYVRMRMVDNIETEYPVKADMALVKDAMDTIALSATDNQMTIVSDWYSAGGGGALKAITNGYKIRGLFTDRETERNMPVSFKSAIEALNAIDCIGWGFVEVNGRLQLRVEPWSWFYKNDVVLTIDGANEVTREIASGDIITEITIGYKKYMTTDDLKSIDSPHGERTYTSKIKAVSNLKSVLCGFIADTYAIEETRRAAFKKDPIEEFKYDENIFIFELMRVKASGAYLVANGIVGESTGFELPRDMYNMRITPWQNLQRWHSFLFGTNSSSNMICNAGTVNYMCGFETADALTDRNNEYLAKATPDVGHKENDPLPMVRRIFKDEVIAFSFPLTIAQYRQVRANPYGLIVVNGEPCWLKDFTYSFADGMAEFKLIPKFV